MTAPKYFRKNFKWAKVSGQRGEWTIGLGWKSNSTAIKVQKANTKVLAECIAEGWVND